MHKCEIRPMKRLLTLPKSRLSNPTKERHVEEADSLP